MRALVDRYGPPRLRRTRGDGHLDVLVRAIVSQQLAGTAVAAIHGRLVARVPPPMTPEAIVATPDEELRAVGLSGAKVAAIKDLADKAAGGLFERIDRLPDEDVVARLTTVRGIGRWTAEMFLIFRLHRLDVWPVDDLGVRKGFGIAYRREMPTAKELVALGDPFRPYRSVTAWYCWRAAEGLPWA